MSHSSSSSGPKVRRKKNRTTRNSTKNAASLEAAESAHPHLSLTQEDLTRARQLFTQFDEDGSETIDVWELGAMFRALDQRLTHDELLELLARYDEDGTGEIEIDEFLLMYADCRSRMNVAWDGDTYEAFIALGGNGDTTGIIRVEQLRNVCQAMALPFDVDLAISGMECSRTGIMDFAEFGRLLKE